MAHVPYKPLNPVNHSIPSPGGLAKLRERHPSASDEYLKRYLIEDEVELLCPEFYTEQRCELSHLPLNRLEKLLGIDSTEPSTPGEVEALLLSRRPPEVSELIASNLASDDVIKFTDSQVRNYRQTRAHGLTRVEAVRRMLEDELAKVCPWMQHDQAAESKDALNKFTLEQLKAQLVKYRRLYKKNRHKKPYELADGTKVFFRPGTRKRTIRMTIDNSHKCKIRVLSERYKLGIPVPDEHPDARPGEMKYVQATPEQYDSDELALVIETIYYAKDVTGHTSQHVRYDYVKDQDEKTRFYIKDNRVETTDGRVIGVECYKVDGKYGIMLENGTFMPVKGHKMKGKMVSKTTLIHYLKTGEWVRKVAGPKKPKKFRARFRDGSKMVHLGYFVTEHERDAAILNYKLCGIGRAER